MSLKREKMNNSPNDHTRFQDVDLKMFHVFAKVVEAGGLSSAQYDLNMSLSAISTAISNLETRLGFRLCERGRSGFQVTEGGHLVYSQLSHLNSALSRFETSLDAFKGDMRGQFLIAMDDGILTNLRCPIYKVMQSFISSFPDIDLHISILPAPRMERALLNNELNLAIGPFLEISNALDSALVYREKQLLCCGRGHPAFGVEDSDKLAQIVAGSEYAARKYDDAKQNAPSASPTETTTASTVEAMLGMVLSGKYLGYLPRHACERWIENKEIWALDPESYAYSTDIKVAFRRQSQDRRAEKFLKALEVIQVKG
ncbi:DNA-binding transcriptional regulator, LysR family [Ruegeria halocynthiae]|uniref:DNA-binding transcriptional regulator, LysR family n=1 Tax=Ruegeria halocynthiae TaxID=985054 RepID=A0A1H3EIE7_9RHOB|nr:LysR family transcriptional regulator [Ruegeria halocynthiae]SDX78365.1 DNA-binding transcriptional regulator, LysR family [Ruegeria halocynthiae]